MTLRCEGENQKFHFDITMGNKEEMSHFVRHDNNDVTPRSDSDEGSPPFKRGYEIALPNSTQKEFLPFWG